MTPILTATAGRHALVAAARAAVRGGGERGGTGAGATPGGSAGGVGSAWTWSGSPAVVRRARLQGWVVAADAPTGFQRVQPLLQAADDVGQRLGLGPGDVQLLLRGRGDPGDASHLALARVYLQLEQLDSPAEVDNQKDVLELCPRSFDVFLQVGFVVENPKPKQQVEQGLNMDRINEINDWFWNPV